MKDVSAMEKQIELRTRDRLEANWGWDAAKGSIPFARPRITPKNIRDQLKLARPGTLIHWAGKPCTRGKSDADQKTETYPLKNGGTGSITYGALASHIENVNCLRCRKAYFGRFLREK